MSEEIKIDQYKMDLPPAQTEMLDLVRKDYIQKLESDLAECRKVLGAMEYCGYRGMCHFCNRHVSEYHKPDCSLTKLLDRIGGK